MLQDLKAGEVKTAILSNGSPDMLDGAVRSAGMGILSTPSYRLKKLGYLNHTKAFMD